MIEIKLIPRGVAIQGKHFNSGSKTYRVIRVMGDMGFLPGGRGVMRCEIVVAWNRISTCRQIAEYDRAFQVKAEPPETRSVVLGPHMAVPGRHYNSGGEVLRVEVVNWTSPTAIGGRLPGSGCLVVSICPGPLSQDDLAILDINHLATLEEIRRASTQPEG